MAQILKQSTAVDVLIGPFVDDGDGNTEETGLTIARADVLLSKNGQTAVQKTDVTSAAHDADGMYNCELDATDTDTIGQLTLYVHVAGALFVRHDYQVIEEAIYNALFASSAVGFDANQRVNVGQFLSQAVTLSAGNKPDVNVEEVSEDATAADNLELMYDGTGYVGGTEKLKVDMVEVNSSALAALRLGLSAGQIVPATVDNATFTPTATQFEADDITEATADHFNGRIILWTTGVLTGQARAIEDYALQNSKGFFTVTSLTEAPGNDDTFIIV